MSLCLQEYIESLMEREQQAEQVKVMDPPMEEESAHTGDLLNLVLVSTPQTAYTANTQI